MTLLFIVFHCVNMRSHRIDCKNICDRIRETRWTRDDSLHAPRKCGKLVIKHEQQLYVNDGKLNANCKIKTESSNDKRFTVNDLRANHSRSMELEIKRGVTKIIKHRYATIQGS